MTAGVERRRDAAMQRSESILFTEKGRAGEVLGGCGLGLGSGLLGEKVRARAQCNVQRRDGSDGEEAGRKDWAGTVRCWRSEQALRAEIRMYWTVTVTKGKVRQV